MSFLKRFKRKKSKSQESPFNKNVELPKQSPAFSEAGPEQMGYIVERSTNPAFQEAWKQHWSSLAENEKVAWSFQGAQSPLKVQKTTEDMDKSHREQSIRRKIGASSLRFLKAIETVMAGASIGIQAYPDVSSIVVAVIRVVINVAVNYFEYYEKLTKMLEGLDDDIRVLDLFTKNNANSPELHQTLVALYTNILAFCRLARRAFFVEGQKGGYNAFLALVKVQWAPFEEEFGEIRSNLNRYTAKLDRVTAVITMNSTLAIQEDIQKMSPENPQNERREFLNWISGDKIEEIHNMICERRLEDTGLYLFKNSKFKEWISENSTGHLWLYGEAGTGKSVLASMVIDHFMQENRQTNSTVAYVYIKGEENNMRHSPHRIVSMLIKQLCWKLDTLPEQSLKYYRQCKQDARLPVFDKLATMLLEFISCLSYVYLIVDGLDECEEKSRKPLLDLICKAGQLSNAKVFVTSRWEWDIERTFSRTKSLTIPNITSDKADIVKVARHRVEKDLGHIKPDIQEEIVQQLVEKSGGIFLWIEFQLNDLAHVLERDMKAQLKQLPSGIQATYIQYLQKINAQPVTSKILAKRCFLWAFHANYLLSSDEFMDAVALTNDHEKTKYDAFDLMAVTKNLIRVYNIGLPRVRPVHFSLQEFVMSLQTGLPVELRELIPDQETANARLAIECLRHLLADIPPEGFLRNILPYCANNFDIHIRKLTDIPEELLQLLDLIILKEPYRLLKILSWRWPVPIGEEPWPQFACVGNPPSIDPMFFLQCTKLDQVPAIRSRFASIKPLETYPDGYLHIAAMTGLEDVVGKLIAQRVDLNREDTGYFTVLQALCDNKIQISEKVVMMLLEAGADPDKPTASEKSAYECTEEYQRLEYRQIIDRFKERK